MPKNICDTMKFFNNFKNPKGKLGDKVIDQMNEKNAQVAIWGLNHFDINEDDVILDIGCGGGTNVKRMALNATGGKVYGLDYSQKAVERSIEYNSSLISEGKVEIVHGEVSDLPFEDCTFNAITAIKSVFFWPDLYSDFREVRRVLKDCGKFVIIADYTGNAKGALKFSTRLMELEGYSDTYLTEILLKSGFRKVTSYVRDTKAKNETVKIDNIKQETIEDTFNGSPSPSDKMDEWICIIAEK